LYCDYPTFFSQVFMPNKLYKGQLAVNAVTNGTSATMPHHDL
jgi:hypothetical protein